MCCTILRVKQRSALFERLFAVQPELRRRFQLAMSPAFKDELGELGGITVHQMEVVRRLLSGDEMTMREVADAHGIGPSGATQLVDRLEQRGLVTRVRDAEDRRVQRVVPTDRARALNRRFRTQVNRALEHLLDALDDAELETYVELAERIARPQAVANAPAARRTA